MTTRGRGPGIIEEGVAEQHPIVPAMRRLLVVASVLTLGGGLAAFVPSERTEDYFAWTIDPPLTAAFLGANYLATSFVLFVAARQRTWSRAALVIPGPLVLMPLTLTVTLMHLDRFDFDSIFGWVWLAAYLVFPVALIPALSLQLAAPGEKPAYEAFGGWVQVAFSLLAVIMLTTGLALFLQPEQSAAVWPWELTPLTGRAVGVWAMTLGAAAVCACWVRSWEGAYAVSLTFAAVATLQLVALARFGDDVDWDGPYAWVYLTVVLGLLMLGLYGAYAANRGSLRT